MFSLVYLSITSARRYYLSITQQRSTHPRPYVSRRNQVREKFLSKQAFFALAGANARGKAASRSLLRGGGVQGLIYHCGGRHTRALARTHTAIQRATGLRDTVNYL